LILSSLELILINHRKNSASDILSSTLKQATVSTVSAHQRPHPLTLNQPTTDAAYYLDPYSRTLLPNLSTKTVDIFNLYVEQRKKTIGMVNTAQFLEVVCGFEIPRAILDLDVFKKIIDDATLLVGLTNELLSVAKDISHFETQPESDGGVSLTSPRQMWTNLVLLYSTLFDQSLQQSITSVATMHNEAVHRFDQHAKCLLQITTDGSQGVPLGWTERINAYLYNMRLCIRGFAYWHVTTPRYTSLWPVDTESRTAFSFGLSAVN